MTVKKELIIELRVPLSGEMFADAATITEVAKAVNAINDMATATFGGAGYTLATRTHTTVPGRGRQANGTGAKRGRKPAASNGAAEPAVAQA